MSKHHLQEPHASTTSWAPERGPGLAYSSLIGAGSTSSSTPALAHIIFPGIMGTLTKCSSDRPPSGGTESVVHSQSECLGAMHTPLSLPPRVSLPAHDSVPASLCHPDHEGSLGSQQAPKGSSARSERSRADCPAYVPQVALVLDRRFCERCKATRRDATRRGKASVGPGL